MDTVKYVSNWVSLRHQFFCNLNLFTDEPFRYTVGGKRSNGYLESCRVNLATDLRMKKEMLGLYSLQLSSIKYRDSYATFSREGKVNFYSTKSIIYVYEVPCGPISLSAPVRDNGKGCNEISSQSCIDFMFYLVRSISPSFLVAHYQGACGDFCYAKGKYFDWIYKTKTPNEYKDYKIRADKFFITLDGKKFFLSPTLDDYHRMVKKGSPHLDDGSNDDYVYDFWDVVEIKDERNRTVTAVSAP